MDMPEGWKKIDKALNYFDYYCDEETGEHLLTIYSQESKNAVLDEARTMHGLLKEMAEALVIVDDLTKQHGVEYPHIEEVLKKFKEWK